MKALFNGAAIADPGHAIPITDRGLNYGDGVFETALLRDGSIRFLQSHLDRLRHGCERLGMACPETALREDIQRIVSDADSGVLKIVVTRGAGGRGYRPEPGLAVNRIVTLHPLNPAQGKQGISVRWCTLRLSRNVALAGIKHLNRLEQVLAQREWDDEHIDEGLMLDTEGELVSATAANVFVVRNGLLVTPDLRFCGVRGVMRSQVLLAAARLGLPCSEEPLWPHDLDDATEMFLTNAVRGIRSVISLDERRWHRGPIATQLSAALAL